MHEATQASLPLAERTKRAGSQMAEAVPADEEHCVQLQPRAVARRSSRGQQVVARGTWVKSAVEEPTRERRCQPVIEVWDTEVPSASPPRQGPKGAVLAAPTLTNPCGRSPLQHRQLRPHCGCRTYSRECGSAWSRARPYLAKLCRIQHGKRAQAAGRLAAVKRH